MKKTEYELLAERQCNYLCLGILAIDEELQKMKMEDISKTPVGKFWESIKEKANEPTRL